MWDSHPLALGATPVQVYIDGIAQLSEPHTLVKSDQLQEAPQTPSWDVEAQQAVDFEGQQPLRGRKLVLGDDFKQGKSVKFINLKSVWMRDDDGHVHTLLDEEDKKGTVTHAVVRGGSFTLCSRGSAPGPCDENENEEIVDLQGGSLAPGLTTFGSPIGLVEIRLEASTTDGVVIDPLTGSVPSIVGGAEAIIRAADGLQFEGRNTLLVLVLCDLQRSDHTCL